MAVTAAVDIYHVGMTVSCIVIASSLPICRIRVLTLFLVALEIIIIIIFFIHEVIIRWEVLGVQGISLGLLLFRLIQIRLLTRVKLVIPEPLEDGPVTASKS